MAIDEILEVWHQTKLNGSKEGTKEGREEEDKFAWIPQRVFECVSFPDCINFEMRNRMLTTPSLLAQRKIPPAEVAP